MNVRILHPLSGLRNGQPYPPRGGIMALPAGDTGRDLIQNGYAELVPDDAVEVAAVVAPENAMRPKPRPRKAG